MFADNNFTNCYGYGGGALFFYSQSDGNIISECNFVDINSGEGYDIYIYGVNISFRQCIFKDTNNNTQGSVLYLTGTLNFYLTDCEFINIHNNGNVSCVSYSVNSEHRGFMNVERCKFISIKMNNSILLSSYCSLNISNTEFNNCVITENTDYIHIVCSDINDDYVENVIFNDCEVKVGGDFISFHNFNSTNKCVYIDNCSFNNYKMKPESDTDLGGSVIFVNYSKLSLNNTNITSASDDHSSSGCYCC